MSSASTCQCCDTGVTYTAKQEERRTTARLIATFLGGAFVLNSFLAVWIFPDDQERGAISAMLGALFLGAPLIVEAFQGLLRGKVVMSQLAALAVAACFAQAMYQEAGIVSFFLHLSFLVERRTALGAEESIEGLIRLTPQSARRVKGGKEEDVPVAHLSLGDVIRVRPGENVPADGTIVSGQSSLNEASVTGESIPCDKGEGDRVFAGTENYSGMIEVKVTSVGDDTTIGKVRNLILEAEKTRLPLMRIIDRHVTWYTPTILMVSALILIFTGDPSAAIAALVVACPCAVVMATPTAMVAGLTCAARLGILIKNVAHLESAGELTAVVCDKTGTLTTGELAVSRLAPVNGVEPGELLLLAASLEQHSNHPVARALVRVANEARLTLIDPKKAEEVGGRGMRGTVDGHDVAIGRESWLQTLKIDFTNLSIPEHKESEGFSTLYVARDGVCIGWVGLEDHTRPEARQAMDELREAGVRNVTMLTGDRWAVARRVADELGCTDVVAECLPEEKLKLVESMKARGLKVAVIGDGVNDAPALAAGDLGIAMGAAGSDIAVNSASIALMNNDLRRLPFLLRLSRLTRRVVYQNLIWGAIFILFGESLAAMGKLTPIEAAVLHLFGSIPVIFNSARIVRFGEEMAPHR